MTTKLVFAIEKVVDVWQDYLDIAHLHWVETDAYRGGERLDPAFDTYSQYEALGLYHLFTARFDNQLVGCCGVYLTPSMQTQQKIATDDGCFIRSEHRRGRNALNFYNYIERWMISNGVTKSFATTKIESRAARILERMGYEMDTVQYCKYLPLQNSAD